MLSHRLVLVLRSVERGGRLDVDETKSLFRGIKDESEARGMDGRTMIRSLLSFMRGDTFSQ